MSNKTKNNPVQASETSLEEVQKTFGLSVHYVDEVTCAIYLLIPSEQVVLLQGIFETYEGLGLVRTISIRDSLISILCTKDTLKDCLSLLNSLKSQISWRNADNITHSEEYLGFTKKGKKNASTNS